MVRPFSTLCATALVALATTAGSATTAFPGNGFHCFGSPLLTGDLMPVGNDPIFGISALLEAHRTQRVVGWLYTTQSGKRYMQFGENGNVVPYSYLGALSQPMPLRVFECKLPMPLKDLPKE
jgi:hypothetical protein